MAGRIPAEPTKPCVDIPGVPAGGSDPHAVAGGAWRVETPGVRIERHGAYDVLVAARKGPLPSRVRIAFTPTDVTLDREYDPAVRFGNGATALYSDQFDVVPTADAKDVDRREAGLSVDDLGGVHVPVRFHDAAGPVSVQGRRQRDPVLTGGETYVVFGAGTLEARGGVAMLADPALPEWLKDDVARFAPKVAATYAARLDDHTDRRLPLLLMAWRGPDAGQGRQRRRGPAGTDLVHFRGRGPAGAQSVRRPPDPLVHRA